MKHFIPYFLFFMISNFTIAQVGIGSGSANSTLRIENPERLINEPTFGRDIILNSKGILKIQPNKFVAIFSLIQTGGTVDLTNQSIDSQIDKATRTIEQEVIGCETFVDMIQFLPKYEVKSEKKLFSKKTYQEIPVGFEVQKNIHVKFDNSNDLNKIIGIMAKNNIYDFVKIDNLRTDLKSKKEEIKLKVISNLKEKLSDYELITDIDINEYEIQFSDQFDVFYPTELYNSYQQDTSYRVDGKVQYSTKPEIQYFNSIKNKDYDIEVTDLENQEPTIEIIYQASLKLVKKDDEKKKYFLNNATGSLEELPN